MSRLEKHLAKRFSGSLEQATKIRNACKIAMDALQNAEVEYAGLQNTDDHIANRKALAAAAGDIYHFGIKPLEAKFSELKDGES